MFKKLIENRLVFILVASVNIKLCLTRLLLYSQVQPQTANARSSADPAMASWRDICMAAVYLLGVPYNTLPKLLPNVESLGALLAPFGSLFAKLALIFISLRPRND